VTSAAADEAARVGEQTARVSVEVFRRGAETASDTMQASFDAAQQNVQHVTDQFTQMLGFTGPQSEEISRRSSENLQAVIEASTVLARGAQEASQQLFDFVQGQLQRNLDAVNRIARSRSVQDVMAVQSELVRDNLQQMIDTNRRVAELSVRVSDEAARTIQARASSSAGQARRAPK
jgi:phasin family protein